MHPPEAPDPKRFWVENKTQTELAEFHGLQTLLTSAYNEVIYFRSAIAIADIGFIEKLRLSKVSVADRSREQHSEMDLVRPWPYIAAHAACNALYQYHEVLDAIVVWASESGAISRFQSKSCAEDARTFFEKAFPKWEQTRHAVAHSAEIAMDYQKNAHRGASRKGIVQKPKGVDALVSNSFQGRTFKTTRKGEFLTLDMTWETYAKFLNVYENLIEAMSPAPPLPPGS